MVNYNDLVANFMNNPRDISTKPIINRPGKWFYVYVENGNIVIDTARLHTPKCSIRKPRILFKKEIEDIYELYIQRKKGVSVSQQAASVTMNQVYWYGIFSEIGL